MPVSTPGWFLPRFLFIFVINDCLPFPVEYSQIYRFLCHRGACSFPFLSGISNLGIQVKDQECQGQSQTRVGKTWAIIVMVTVITTVYEGMQCVRHCVRHFQYIFLSNTQAHFTAQDTEAHIGFRWFAWDLLAVDETRILIQIWLRSCCTFHCSSLIRSNIWIWGSE